MNTNVHGHILGIDVEDPIVSFCPSDIVVCEDQNQVSWPTPVFSDNCSLATVSSSHNPGDTFSLGNTEVTYTALDLYGNSVTCSFNILVHQQPYFSVITTDASCFEYNDGTAQLNIVGGVAPYTEDWGGEDPDSLQEGSYMVSLIDSNGCVEIENFSSLQQCCTIIL